ncbi:hypothetical protein CGSHiR3021_00512 [Haemophilus influenzae 22.4-21]|uniref:Uncharacterized protein n=1 Tax=Haemophilus influenzae 22.4-21 TaxID=375063 RepID=A4P166_HAEIF|nr:hypothetical protein CGSHiR3021_00512 [Haemophilus influenzae 22.4-21]
MLSGLFLGLNKNAVSFSAANGVFNAIHGSESGWRFSPNQLAAIFQK